MFAELFLLLYISTHLYLYFHQWKQSVSGPNVKYHIKHNQTQVQHTDFNFCLKPHSITLLSCSSSVSFHYNNLSGPCNSFISKDVSNRRRTSNMITKKHILLFSQEHKRVLGHIFKTKMQGKHLIKS